MASKKSKNKIQTKPAETKTTSTATRVMQIIFVIFSILIVLSMILTAFITY